MIRSIVQLFDERVSQSPLSVAQYWKNDNGKFISKTYIQLQEDVRSLALALRDLNVKRGDNVAIVSDNCPEWLVSDLAILSLGATDVPRGRDSLSHELEYIISFSGARVVFSENKIQTEKILSSTDKLLSLEMIVAFDDIKIEDERVKVIKYSELLKRGKELIASPDKRDKIAHEIMLGAEDDDATIIFTSGTTGTPKGVVLSHRAFLYQVENIHTVAPFEKGQIWLSVLPVWHAFERILQYVAIYETHSIAYSKPIGKIMLYDMQNINPHFIGSVPRIWETIKAGVEHAISMKSKKERIMFSFFLLASKKYKYCLRASKGLFPHYEKRDCIVRRILFVLPCVLLRPVNAIANKVAFKAIKQKLGKSFIGGISGGGSMNPDVSEFFDSIGIELLDGYGLTESGPVVGTSLFFNNIPGFMKKLEGTEIKVVDPLSQKELPAGSKGELLVKGPQLMSKYYKDDERTRLAIDEDGFLHTGDIAKATIDGWFSIFGRIKDTIVLSGGENVEPVFIEQALSNSIYIERAVVVGQDRKNLGALILIDKKNVELYLKNSSIPYISRDGLAQIDEVRTLVSREIMRNVSKEKGFKAFEQISKFIILEKPFEIGKELSLKQEIKRMDINEIYRKEIDSLWG